MKDLLFYVADADAMAFMQAILEKPRALGIRQIQVDFERHPQRDAGMVQSGAELVRMKKGFYQKALLMWDHHGSGRDRSHRPELVQHQIQSKLDTFTWQNNSAVIILVPELEEWIWYCESAILGHYGMTHAQLGQWMDDGVKKLGGTTADGVKVGHPKELFEYVVRYRLHRTISPRDFHEIAKRASIPKLMQCHSFFSIVEKLRVWFPS